MGWLILLKVLWLFTREKHSRSNCIPWGVLSLTKAQVKKSAHLKVPPYIACLHRQYTLNLICPEPKLLRLSRDKNGLVLSYPFRCWYLLKDSVCIFLLFAPVVKASSSYVKFIPLRDLSNFCQRGERERDRKCHALKHQIHVAYENFKRTMIKARIPTLDYWARLAVAKLTGSCSPLSTSHPAPTVQLQNSVGRHTSCESHKRFKIQGQIVWSFWFPVDGWCNDFY
jgi:hypothetical protein